MTPRERSRHKSQSHFPKHKFVTFFKIITMETNDDTTNSEMAESPPRQGATGLEIDDDLRQIEQQFSCLGTTDKDVLIKQLQKIVGSGLNAYAAQFFLDMNNWNLQLAVGSYFDLVGTTTDSLQRPHPQPHSPHTKSTIVGSTTLYSCEFDTDLSIEMEPNKETGVEIFFRNNGDSSWPNGCSLRILPSSDLNLAIDTDSWTIDRVDLPNTLLPHSSMSLKLSLCLPPMEKEVVSMQWQMCTPEGYLFGQLLNIRVKRGLLIDTVASRFNGLSCE